MPQSQTDADKKAPHPHPLTLRPKDLADRLGVTRRYLYDLLKHPDPVRRLPAPLKIGRATFWRIEDVQAWLTRQADRNAA
jgi:predicted DNA-binding transcriptional regulator AlpA